MPKINVKICLGTTCYVFGASSLLLIEQFLDDHIKNQIEIEGTPCLDLCKQENKTNRPPFAIVNNKIIENATIETIIEAIKGKLNNENNK